MLCLFFDLFPRQNVHDSVHDDDDQKRDCCEQQVGESALDAVKIAAEKQNFDVKIQPLRVSIGLF